MITGLVHNFPCENQLLDIQFDHKCDKCGKLNCHHVKLYSGFQDVFNLDRKIHFLNDFFCAMLLNDKLFIMAADLVWLFKLFNLSELHDLFHAGVIEIINTSIAHAGISEDKKKLRTGFRTISGNYLDTIERKLSEISPTGKLNQPGQNILYNIEVNHKSIDDRNIMSELAEETNHDLQLKNVRKGLGIITKELSKIRRIDIIKILGLFYNNRALNIASQINVDNIILDSYSKQFIEAKLRPSEMNHFLARTTSVSIFSNLNDLKGIPNLGKLFVSKIISLKDILNLRSNIEGQLFRVWFKSKEYNENEVKRILMNNKDESLLVKYTNKVRWLIPPLVGVVGGPPSGIVAAYANSKFVTKFLNGWHPNLYLDNVLRKKIEERNTSHQKEVKAKLIERRKPKVQRNDPCLCGSGNKFKNCCG